MLYRPDTDCCRRGMNAVFIAVLLILGATVQMTPAPSEVCHYVEPDIYSQCWSVFTCSGYHRARTATRCCRRHDGNQCLLTSACTDVCESLCNGCNEPRICEMPTTQCVCPAGWMGEHCSEDVNECQVWGICKHDCINTAGSYLCSCPDGSVLAEDQSSCIESPWNVTLSATSPTSMRLTWEYPHSDDVDGYLTQFSVSCPPDRVHIVSSSQHSLIMDSLSPYSVYNCCVTANTTIGLSNPICDIENTLEVYMSTVFTVAFVNVQKCTQWILEMPLGKSVDMMMEISKGIHQFCHCQFTSDYIRNGSLLCDQETCHSVVFQGRILSTNDRNSTELLEDLEKWVSSKPTVVVQGEQLQVVSSETQSKLNCEEQEKNNVLSATLGSFAAVILVLLCLITATVFGVLYCKWRLTKQRSGLKAEVTYQEVAVATPTSSADVVVLKELLNPLYDRCSTNTSRPAEYEMPHQQENHVALTNPTFGMATPRESNGDPVSISMSGVNSPQHGTANASNDHVYCEIPAQNEDHIYAILDRC